MSVEIIISQYLKSIKYNEPVLIRKKYSNCTVEIICTKPGLIIGLDGKPINELQDKLKRETHGNISHVRIIEADEVVTSDQNWDKICDERAKARLEMYN